MPDLLNTETVASYLAGRGVVQRGEPIRAVALGGGVSNVVLAVFAGGRRLVVKQSLPQLRVADQWLAKRERVITEAAALRWAGRLIPGSVPDVLDVDAPAFTITIAHAPEGWRVWKDALLAGEADRAVAQRLGQELAVWHVASHADPAALGRFDDVEAFEQLRVDPYYRTVMRRHPSLAAAIEPYVTTMLATPCCLVHGDYSPKNVLFGPGASSSAGAGDGLWVVDFEVAHRGDPAFDLAFMLNHLLLKSIHRPACRDAYARCALAFWDAYHAGIPARFAGPPDYILGHLACLLLARVDGKSPAEYLSPPEQEAARALGVALLTAPPAAPQQVWQALQAGVGR